MQETLWKMSGQAACRLAKAPGPRRFRLQSFVPNPHIIGFYLAG